MVYTAVLPLMVRPVRPLVKEASLEVVLAELSVMLATSVRRIEPLLAMV